MDYKLSKLYNKMQVNTIREALGLSNYSYQVPADPEEKLFDFYYLTLIGKPESLESTIQKRTWGGWIKTDQADPMGSGFFNDEQIQELIAATSEAQNKIANELQTDLLDATYFSLAAEFRHVLDYNELEKVMAFADAAGYGKEFAKWYTKFKTSGNIKDKKNIVKSIADKNDPISNLAIRADVYTGSAATDRQAKKDLDVFLKGDKSRIASYAAAKNAFADDYAFVDLCEKCYFGTTDGYAGKLKWAHAYGGPAWGRIAQGWKKLHDARDFLDRMIWVDHILDLEHNTGAMLNKVSRWAKNSSWNWIRKALDFKRDAQSPLKDFLDKISPSLSYLDKRIRYGITGLAQDRQDELDKQINNASVMTNSGASADSTSFGIAGDTVSTQTGATGEIFKIGSTGKAYVDVDPGSVPSSMAGTVDQYYIKFDKQGKPEGLLGKTTNNKQTMSGSQMGMFGALQKGGVNTPGKTFAELKVGDKVATDKGVQGSVKKIYPGHQEIVISFDNNFDFGSKAKHLKAWGPSGTIKAWGNKSTPIGNMFWKSLPPTKYGKLILSGSASPSTVASVAATGAALGGGGGSIPAAPPMTKANSTVLNNQGLYTKLLGKFHPKTIAHTGPAGQAGVKSLIIKLDAYGQSGVGRSGYTGHLKVKTSHAGANVLFYDKNETGKGLKFNIAPMKKAKPWQDKALAIDLKFAVVKKKLVIKGGRIVQAILGQNVIIDGPVNLDTCQLNGCAFTKLGLEQATMTDCNVKVTHVIDPNKFANTSAFANWGNLIAFTPTAVSIPAINPGVGKNGQVSSHTTNEATDFFVSQQI